MRNTKQDQLKVSTTNVKSLVEPNEELLGVAMRGEMLEYVAMAVQTVMGAFFDKLPGMIAASVETAMGARNGIPAGCLGKEAAKVHVTSRIRAIARLFEGVGVSTKELNRAIKNIERDLKLNAGVVVDDWAYLPKAKLHRVQNELVIMEQAALEDAREKAQEQRERVEQGILKKWANESN